jgi:sulfonate transport system permease protein
LAAAVEPTRERAVAAGYGRVSAKAWLKPVFARWWDKGIGVILPVAILASWQLATGPLHLVKPVFLPSPWAVVTTFWDLLAHQDLLRDVRTSATVVVQGFLLGSTLGVGIGILSGLSKTVERFLGPTLNSLRQVPTLAWLPLIVLWIGMGTVAKSVLIGKAVFFPVFLNTLQGIRGVSKEYIEVGEIFEYGRGRLLRKVILPAAAPSIFVGLRYGAGLAWAFVIAAEMLGGHYGLGYLLMRAQELLLTDQLFVVIVIIGTVGYFVDTGLRKVEGHLLRWKKGFEG